MEAIVGDRRAVRAREDSHRPCRGLRPATQCRPVAAIVSRVDMAALRLTRSRRRELPLRVHGKVRSRLLRGRQAAVGSEADWRTGQREINIAGYPRTLP